jgi:hypothetical protein
MYIIISVLIPFQQFCVDDFLIKKTTFFLAISNQKSKGY